MFVATERLVADQEPANQPLTATTETDTATPHSSIDQKPGALIERASHPVFIVSYIANLAIVAANTATFIFADWVAWLAEHGTLTSAYQEELPGRVIQYGVIAALFARIFLGQSIDRFGVRRVWLLMSTLALCGLGIFASLTTMSPLLYLGRILLATGLAGMFTSGMFHIQWCVADNRRTEFIALLGSSGFVGMMLGPQLADLLRWLFPEESVFFSAVFRMAFLLILVYIVCVVVVTRKMPVPQPKATRPSLIKLMRNYWPGWVMLVSMVMGVVFTVPSLYLVRFNQHEGFGGIATYWTTYAITAFVFRIRTAALSRRVGRYRLILLGLVTQGLGLWAIVPATEWWHLLFSAMLCGFGHAFLFPSIVSLGSGTFPPEYRGSGTNLTLGFLDLGAGISAPLLGRIIDVGSADSDGFRTMFLAAGAVPLSVAVLWFFLKCRQSDEEAAATT